MLDLKFIIENQKLVTDNAKKKNFPIDIAAIVELDKQRRDLLQKSETLRAEQKKLGKDDIEKAKKLKTEIKELESELDHIQKDLNHLTAEVPNMLLDSTPVGASEEENKTERKEGSIPEFKDFKPKDHITLGTELGILDLEKAAEMSGARFYYLKNEGALLEFALTQFVMQKLVSKGFHPVIPPVLVKEQAMFATGFFPAERNEIYNVNPEDDNLYLVGTSEVPLTMLHAKDVLHEKDLPLRYCAFSTCFRREAGSYGKDTKGIIRVHQFDKIEMFSFCHPEKSEEEHEFLVGIEEEILQDLGLPYQLVNICSGDLGAPAAKKYDLEAWIPTQEKYREVTSCSNCTDYQARRAKIKFKPEISNPETQRSNFIHTLNGTACAMPRIIVAIMENFQKEDGTIEIPEVLKPYMPKS
jgi:seryl-tRNA synthetase